MTPLCAGDEFAYSRFALGGEWPRVSLCHEDLLDLSVAAKGLCAKRSCQSSKRITATQQQSLFVNTAREERIPPNPEGSVTVLTYGLRYSIG